MKLLRVLVLSCAAVTATASAGGAHLLAQVEQELGARAETVRVEADDGSAAAQMPCASPLDLSLAVTGNIEGKMCSVGNVKLLFLIVQGPDSKPGNPFSADYKKLRDAARNSSDTKNFTEDVVRGKRVIRAEQGPPPKFGRMAAVEVAPNKIIYAVAMSNPSREVSIAEYDKQRAIAFVDSLEVSP